MLLDPRNDEQGHKERVSDQHPTKREAELFLNGHLSDLQLSNVFATLTAGVMPTEANPEGLFDETQDPAQMKQLGMKEARAHGEGASATKDFASALEDVSPILRRLGDKNGKGKKAPQSKLPVTTSGRLADGLTGNGSSFVAARNTVASHSASSTGGLNPGLMSPATMSEEDSHSPMGPHVTPLPQTEALLPDAAGGGGQDTVNHIAIHIADVSDPHGLARALHQELRWAGIEAEGSA